MRQETVGDPVHLRGIIEFSNYCCGLVPTAGCGPNDGIRLPDPPDEVVERPFTPGAWRQDRRAAVRRGWWWTAERLADMVSHVKARRSWPYPVGR